MFIFFRQLETMWGDARFTERNPIEIIYGTIVIL